MNQTSILYIRTLVRQASDEARYGNFAQAWAILEESHIISQPSAHMHIVVHWHMLLLAFKQRSKREMLGQIPRLILAGPGSLFGKYPLGNTGRSNVSMFLSMPISKEMEVKIRRLSGGD